MIVALVNQFRLTWRLLRDPRVPTWQKAIPFLALVYVLSPVDFIPDVIPGLGQIDDIGIVLAGMRLFEALAGEPLAQEHRRKLKRS